MLAAFKCSLVVIMQLSCRPHYASCPSVRPSVRLSRTRFQLISVCHACCRLFVEVCNNPRC